jgi:site-specific DNA recombinase
MKYYLYARKSSEDKNKQVASIEDQIAEMKKVAEHHDLNIIKIFQESKSAKKPNNREQFSLMIQELYEGKADGIICWKLDRLARNPMEGGIIKQMIQDSTITKIHTHGNEYKTGDNVLLMDMEFGIANQFILDLSKNTKRGLNSKAERGQFPSRAPIGYLNHKYENKGQKRISPDHDKFQLVRKVWDYMLTGKHSTYSATRYAQEELGLTGYTGKPIPKNVLYNMFSNPFYYGNFIWGGKEYIGEHEPMITMSEFLMVQGFLSEKVKVNNNHKYYHPYTKIFTCGECGNYLTASKKKRTYKNGTVQHFTYYHCVKRVTNRCSQGSIEIKSLEEQILIKAGTLQLPKQITDYCLDLLHTELQNESNVNQKVINQRQGEVKKIDTKIETLFDMRLSGDIDSEGYSKRRNDLESQKKEVENKITVLKESNNADIYKNVKRGFNLQKEYQEAMEKADIEEKRFLIKQVGSEYTAKDKQIYIELKPIYKEVLSLVNSIKSEYSLIEPKKAIAMQGSFSDLDRISPLMGDYRELNPNCRYHKPE